MCPLRKTVKIDQNRYGLKSQVIPEVGIEPIRFLTRFFDVFDFVIIFSLPGYWSTFQKPLKNDLFLKTLKTWADMVCGPQKLVKNPKNGLF